MANLELLSVRLDPETKRAIEQLTVHHPYWKRNAIINQLLTTLIRCADNQAIWNMLSVTFAYDKGYVVKFQPDAEVLRQRSEKAKSKSL